MSKEEIIEELPKLSLEDRAEIQARIEELAGEGWHDADDPLTDAEKALIEARIEEHERNPATAIPWQEFDARLKRRLGE
jgi:putative addiction module component (TIGR02574 family)